MDATKNCGMVTQPVYSTISAKKDKLDKVYSMRYKSYSQKGYIDKNTSLKFMDEYDSQPNCTSHLLYYGENPVASIRICLYEPCQSFIVPAMEVYSQEIKSSITLNSAFIEVNKFVVEPDFQQKGGLYARFMLFKLVTEQCILFDATSMLAAVRPEHISFYKILGFHPISNIKTYPHLNFKTVLLTCTDVKKTHEFINRKLRFV